MSPLRTYLIGIADSWSRLYKTYEAATNESAKDFIRKTLNDVAGTLDRRNPELAEEDEGCLEVTWFKIYKEDV